MPRTRPQADLFEATLTKERMLRIHFIQHWFNLADLAGEEALYDSASLRRFVGIDLGKKATINAGDLWGPGATRP